MVGTDIAELLLQDHKTVWLPGKSPNEANLIDFTNEALEQAEQEESGEAQLSFLTESLLTSAGSLEKETERFRELLLYGRKKVGSCTEVALARVCLSVTKKDQDSGRLPRPRAAASSPSPPAAPWPLCLLQGCHFWETRLGSVGLFLGQLPGAANSLPFASAGGGQEAGSCRPQKCQPLWPAGGLFVAHQLVQTVAALGQDARTGGAACAVRGRV